MKKQVLFGIALLLLSGYAYSMQSAYMFVSLSYGRGWWPWVCFTEHGVKGIGEPYNSCGARDCPFEEAKFVGVDCVDYSKLSPDYSKCNNLSETAYENCLTNVTESYNYTSVMNASYWAEIQPGSWGLVTEITADSDLKLVTSDNFVVDDKVCRGEAFKPVKGVNKGEYWSDGGHQDSPPIYWVDDVKEFVKKVMDYHEKTFTKASDIFSNEEVPEGYIDELTGIPVYDTPLMSSEQEKELGVSSLGYNLGMTGNVVCSMNKVNDSTATDFINVYESGKDIIDVNEVYAVECSYYYYKTPTGYVVQVPTVLQAGPDATVNDWGTHNIMFNSTDDFFKVGTVTLSKRIRITDPAKPSLEITVPGFDNPVYGAANNLRLVLNNKGDVNLTIRGIRSSVKSKTVSCDSETVQPDESSECLVSVTPEKGKRLDVFVDYKYRSCGRWVLATALKRLIDYQDITPAASAQAYGFDVYGGCRNDYFGCDAPSREGTFVAGYRCFNKDGKYNVPSIGRFDLKFGLSALPKDKEILGARLYLNAKNVYKAQTISVYSTPNDNWQPAGCVPGGDICAQPWCKECLPLYDFAGKKESSIEVGGPGEYSLDVSDYIKGVIGKGSKYASLQMMGQEDEWNAEGEKTCAKQGEWAGQDMEFYGTGDKVPYLEVLYK